MMGLASNLTNLLRLVYLEIESHFRFNSRRLEKLIRQGETPTVDFKERLELTGENRHKHRATLLKEVSAIANSNNTLRPGYLIIGVKDREKNPGLSLKELVVGIDTMRLNEQLIQQVIFNHCYPPVRVSFKSIHYQDKSVGVITIPRSRDKPHSIIRPVGDIEKEDVFVRRGSHTFPATVAEIFKMCGNPAWKYLSFALLLFLAVALVGVLMITILPESCDTYEDCKARAEEARDSEEYLKAYYYWEKTASAYEEEHDIRLSRPTKGQRGVLRQLARRYRFDLAAIALAMSVWWWPPVPLNYVLVLFLFALVARWLFKRFRKRET